MDVPVERKAALGPHPSQWFDWFAVLVAEIPVVVGRANHNELSRDPAHLPLVREPDLVLLALQVVLQLAVIATIHVGGFPGLDDPLPAVASMRARSSLLNGRRWPNHSACAHSAR
ncbi:MAG TPA: hypothetical protein VHN14_29830, partial [Kofleriaceae bacterium]|nr:hypothetical protein [Kofleriaceae bacterium]